MPLKVIFALLTLIYNPHCFTSNTELDWEKIDNIDLKTLENETKKLAHEPLKDEEQEKTNRETNGLEEFLSPFTNNSEKTRKRTKFFPPSPPLSERPKNKNSNNKNSAATKQTQGPKKTERKKRYPGQKALQCKVCKKKFFYLGSLLKHTQTHTTPTQTVSPHNLIDRYNSRK